MSRDGEAIGQIPGKPGQAVFGPLDATETSTTKVSRLQLPDASAWHVRITGLAAQQTRHSGSDILYCLQEQQAAAASEASVSSGLHAEQARPACSCS